MAHAALLVVHGIGAQERGETLAKLVSGLRRVQPQSVPDAIHDGMVATISGRTVRLYEVYWADRLKGELTRGAFLLNELQSVSWFPWYNVRCGNYPSGSYSFLKLAWWIVALPLVNFFVLWAYFGANFLVQIVTNNTKRPSRLDVILDEFVGDVFSYVNSAGKAFYREKDEPAPPPHMEQAYAEIVQGFHQQLLRADADGCDTIQIVAHSLGTVVAYHALSGFGLDPLRPDAGAIKAAMSKITRLYTIGSPLEKIRFFWPRIVPVAALRPDMALRWENFVSYFDPVSGTLRSFHDWGTVSNSHLLGGGVLRAHVVYERSPVFLGALTEGLCGRAVPFERSLKERLWDGILLTGETLAAPAALVAVLAIGAGFFLLAATLLPFLVSLPFRFFLTTETWAPWVDGASYVILASMFLAFLVGPMNRARKVHSLYWNEKRAEPAQSESVKT
jgi:hypothetical protein